MKQLLIYEQPTPLNRTSHREVRLDVVPGDFSFAKEVNSIPLAGAEFARAARHYPIVFAGNSPDDVVPAALLGLRDRQNLMVDAEGYWEADAYIPAFLRRYPFVLAEVPDSDKPDYTVCLDLGYPWLKQGGEEGERLFDEDGKDTALLTNAMAFLQEYQVHLARTREFTRRLAKLELLIPRQVQVQSAQGDAYALDGFFVVDEEKLRGLKGRGVQELLRTGDMGWTYIHLMSLSNVELLSRRQDKLVLGNTSGAH